MHASESTPDTLDDKAQPPTPPSAPQVPPIPPANSFTEPTTQSTAPSIEPVFGTAFEVVDAEKEDEASQPFSPQLLRFDEGDSRLVYPFAALSVTTSVHWYGAPDFRKSCVSCCGKDQGCPLCRAKQNPKTEVILPTIDLGPQVPGFIKFEKKGGAARKDGTGESLYSQIRLILIGNHPPATTGIRITKNDRGMFVATAVPLEPSDLPPPALIERFTAHLALPRTEIFGAFIRFDQPDDLLQVPSIRRMVDQAARG